MFNKVGCIIRSIDSFDSGFSPKVMCEGREVFFFREELFQIYMLSILLYLLLPFTAWTFLFPFINENHPKKNQKFILACFFCL